MSARIAWALARQGSAQLRKAKQILNVIADSARVLVSKGAQSGFDERWLRAFTKAEKQEAEVARELSTLLKSLEKWLGSVERNPKTRAELRQEFDELLNQARERQRSQFQPGKVGGKSVTDIRGSVGAAARLPASGEALGQAVGRDLTSSLKQYIAALKRAGLAGSALEDATEEAGRILSGFLKAWESRLPTKDIQTIMDRFAKQMESTRQKILPLRAQQAKGLTSAAEDRRLGKLTGQLTDRLREVFKTGRRSVLRAVFNDTQLRQQLEQVGLVVDRGDSSISFELNLGSPQLPAKGSVGAAVSASTAAAPEIRITLNIDHSTTDFADAVDNWVATGNTSALYPILSGSNMRIATGLENQVLFNRLKDEAQKWAKSIPTTLTKGTESALQSTAWETQVDDVVSKIEKLLGRSLSPADRTLIRDYADMAMQMSTP